jgi:hypothetical protein
VLSLLGGLAAFSLGRSRESRVLVGGLLFVFSASLLVGTAWGAIMRDAVEQYNRSEHALMQQAFIESSVNAFRKQRGLPPLSATKPEKEENE